MNLLTNLLLISLLVFSNVAADDRSLAATGDLSLPSSGLILNSDIKLYYQIDSGTLSLMLDVQNQGWVSIGFTGTMFNCDMVVFTTSGGTVSVTDVYSSGEVTPSASETQDWTITGQDLQANSFKVKATRLLTTGDSMDQVLALGQQYTFCAAWDTSPSFAMHSGTTSFSVNLSNGLGLLAASSQSNGASESELDAHKIILFYGWGICVDISIFVVRYLKTWKHYVLTHTLIFLLLDISTIVVTAIILGENQSKLSQIDGLSTDVKNHYIIGVIILAIVIIQHIMGVILKINSEGNSKYVHLIKKFHQVFGILLYFLCKANVYIGADLEGEYVGGIIITAVSISFLIIAEIMSRIFRHQSLHEVYDYSYTQVEMSIRKKSDEEGIQLMKLLNEEHRDVDQILAALPNMKWVIYNQAVYDITDFIHPGGQYITNQVKGKEIGRYLNGSLGLEGFDTPSYTHSPNAIKYLRRYFVGYLEYADSNILSIELGQNEQKGDPKTSLRLFNPFKLEKVVALSSSISQFDFKSSTIKIQNVVKGIHWIGRHFQIKIESQNKSRCYTQVLCQTPQNQLFRSQIIDLAEQTLNGKPATTSNVASQATFSDTLPFIIKKYNFKRALSKQLHEENANNQYSIQGPLGTGLGFSEATQNKRIYIFAVGTGILPFLDLFDFLLKKTLVQLMPQHKDKLDPFSIGYEKYLNGCQFTIFTGFHSIEDFIGREWILKLLEFSKKANNNLIKLNIKIKEGSFPEEVGRITHKSYGAYIQENVNDSQFDKVFICGPPQMYNQVIESLKKKGVPCSKMVNV